MIFKDATVDEVKFLRRLEWLLQKVEDNLHAQDALAASLSMTNPVVERSKLSKSVQYHKEALRLIMNHHRPDDMGG